MSTGETYTFVSDNKIFKVTIKAEFLKIIPKPEEHVFHDLMTQHSMPQYLHNPNGPAMVVLTNGHEEYWIDGKRCTDEVAEKMKHTIKSFDTLEKELEK